MFKSGTYRRNMLVLTGLLVLTMPVFSKAANIGVVNISRVFDESPQAESARIRIEKEFSGKEKKIVAKSKQLKSIEQKLTKTSAVMSDSERQKQKDKIRKLRREVKRLQEEFKEDLNLRRSQELSKLQSQVSKVIEKLAKQQKLDVILGDGVIWANNKVDITSKVISAMERAQR